MERELGAVVSEEQITFAGVIPFAMNAEGTLSLLLGVENYGRERGKWSGFAGRVEDVDGGNPLVTAAREGYEESAGLLGTPSDLKNFLERKGVEHRTARGVHYLLPFQYNSYLPVMFQGVQAAIKSGDRPCPRMLEKAAIAWCSEDVLTTLPLRFGFSKDLESVLCSARKSTSAKK